MKKLTTALVALVLCVSMAIGLLNTRMVAYAEINDGVNATNSVYPEDGYVFLDHSATLRDPIKITSQNAGRYEPTSYVYFGDVYNSVTGEYEPILARVLDADNDNAGGDGAMFLLAENAIVSDQIFSDVEDTGEFVDYRNVYTESAINNIELSSFFSPEEIGLIRAITKTDVAENMLGMFGFVDDGYYYTWETDEFDGSNAVYADSAELLKDSYIFPLSVEELYKYVADHGGSDALSTLSFETGEPVSWWLRTGVNDYGGDYVGVVGSDGMVTIASAQQSEIAFRPAFNVETEGISYLQAVENNTYRLAFYTDVADDFEAKIVSMADGEVTIKYKNAPIDIYEDDGKTGYISVIITDSTNEVRHYGTVSSVVGSSGEITFTLPEYVQPEYDRLYAFWEDKADNNKSVSFTSKFTDLGIIHDFDNGICRECGAYQPPFLNDNGTDGNTADDYYEISNAGHLYWFANQLNTGNTSINAKLIADITVNENVLNTDGTLNGDGSNLRAWTPIGNLYRMYSGTFDGDGHTVGGLYLNDSSKSYAGLFGYVGGTVKNVGVIDSYFSGSVVVGGVVGCSAVNSVIVGCYNTGTVNGSGSCVGGVVGSNCGGVIQNCSNAGMVSGADSVGGIAGESISGGSVQNCYNVGVIIGNEEVGGVVGSNNYGSTVTNCYYLLDTAVGGINGYNVNGSAEVKTAAEFASGEVAYKLGEGFGQSIGNDEYPVLGGEKLYIGYPSCAPDMTKTYTNDETIPQDKIHRDSDSDNKCDECLSDVFVFEEMTYRIVGDITNEGFALTDSNLSYKDELQGYRAGEGYLLVYDEKSVVLYNATIDIRGTEHLDGVLSRSTNSAYDEGCSIIFYGTNNIYSKYDVYAISLTSESTEITGSRIIGAEGAVLNVYGLVYAEALTFEGGTVNIYGVSAMGSSLICDVLVIEADTVVNASSVSVVDENGEKVETFWIEILVTTEYTVEGTLNGIICHVFDIDAGIVKYTVYGDVTAKHNFIVYPEAFGDIGIEIIFEIPEGTSVTIPEGYKIDMTTFDSTDIRGDLIVYGELICNHEGGSATCIDRAICDVCKQRYGELSAANHVTAEVKYSSNGNGTHREIYTCCDGIKNESLSCAGGVATCTAKAICSLCGTEYGQLLDHSYGSAWITNENEHWNECVCEDEANKASHTDTDGDEVCDTCGYAMPKAPTVPDDDTDGEGEAEVNPDKNETNDAETDVEEPSKSYTLGDGIIIGIVMGIAVLVLLICIVIKKRI